MMKFSLSPIALPLLVLSLASCGADKDTDCSGRACAEDEVFADKNPQTSGSDTSADNIFDNEVDPNASNQEDTSLESFFVEGVNHQIDLLFIIDNSGSTAEEQRNLARNFPGLIRQLRALPDNDGTRKVDFHIMVTTTDMQNSACTSSADFKTSGATLGQPVTTGCRSRLDDFVALGSEIDFSDACTSVCPQDIVPEDGRPYIQFNENGDNLPDSKDVDVDGDMSPDDVVGRALACMGPQGVRGCWHEAPLDAMLGAIASDAPHNTGKDPFLRPDATLAIAIVTDEADCSINEGAHPEIFDPSGPKEFWGVHPTFGTKIASSATCWDAGVECDGPDAAGEYSNCKAKASPLVDLANYKTALRKIVEKDKEVIMLGILGVPEVTKHEQEAPYLPLEGGVESLVYRDWKDGEFPAGDILPSSGVSVEEQRWEYGIGPGCTGKDSSGNFTGQAVPPLRVREVCESLNGDDKDGNYRTRCCIESICDDDFSSAMNCLAGLIEKTPPPVL